MALTNYKSTNYWHGILSVGIDSVTPTLVLSTGQWNLFPSTFPFAAKVFQKDTNGNITKQEMIRVTGRAWDILTVVRWAEVIPPDYTSTTPWSTTFDFATIDGDIYVNQVYSKAVQDDMNAELVRLETDKLDISDYISWALLFASSTTGNDTYQATFADISSYPQINWQELRVQVDTTNTSVATFEVNGLWAKVIKKRGGDDLVNGDIKAGQIMVILWNDTQDYFELVESIDQRSQAVAIGLVDVDTYILGEDVSAGESLFVEDIVTFADSTQVQNIGDVTANTRVSFAAFGSWEAASTLNLSLKKFVSPSVDLGLRIETDNAGSPSGTLFDPWAVWTIATSGLTTSLADTQVLFWGAVEAHWVTLNVNEAASTTYKGVKIDITVDCWIINATKVAACTATTAYLCDENGIILASAAFVANVATLNYSGLITWNSYYVVAGSGWSSYTSVKQTGSASFPYVWTKLDFVGGWEITLATTDTEALPNLYTFGSHAERWVVILCNINSNITSVQLNVNVDGRTVFVKDSTWTTTLWTATVAWGNATFSTPIPITAWTQYRITLNSFSGVWYGRDAGTYVHTNISFVWNIPSVRQYYILWVTTVWAPVTNNNVNNIVSVEDSNSLTIPLWEKVHLVLFPWTYGSETINGSNYFGVGYTAKDTSTRTWKIWNGSAWSTSITPDVTDTDNITFTASWSATISLWYVVRADYDLYIKTVNKSATATATRCRIFDMLWNVLATQAFAWNVATFWTPILVIQWEYVRVECDNSWGTYTMHRLLSATFPQVRTNITYIFWSQNWTTDLPTTAYNIDSIITYVSWPFFYVDWDGFEDKLLSLTDAKFPYKLPTDIPRLATESKLAWDSVISTTYWINEQVSWLTALTDYYISSTPWLISSTLPLPTEYAYMIWKTISPTKIFVWLRSAIYRLAYTTLNSAQSGTGTTTSSTYLCRDNEFITAVMAASSAWGASAWTATLQYSLDWSTGWTDIYIEAQVNTSASISDKIGFFLRKWIYYRTTSVCTTSGTASFTLRAAQYI